MKINKSNDEMIKKAQKHIVIAVNILGIFERFFQMVSSKNKLERIMIRKKEINR